MITPFSFVADDLLRNRRQKFYIPKAFFSFFFKRAVTLDVSCFINEIKHKACEKGWLNCCNVQSSLWVRVEKHRMVNESVFICFLVLGTSNSVHLFSLFTKLDERRSPFCSLFCSIYYYFELSHFISIAAY